MDDETLTEVAKEQKQTESGGEVSSPSHIVGVGASAGGLEALQTFFSVLPGNTGAAYVVVQHLSPDFKSLMDQLLGKYTTMPVRVARDGEPVLPDTIYLNPPKKNMIIAEGKLFLSDLPPKSGLNLPIDTFFRSLAEDQQHRAIGVVLSGSGSDGSKGVRALKEAGGMVIVQDPTDAQFDGMPNSAVNTGQADLILSADDMPAKLQAYITHPMLSSKDHRFKQHLADNEDVLEKIFAILRRSSEIDFSQYKPSSVARRIERRLAINSIASLADYCEFMLESPKEVQILSKELLIGVTRFFRDPEAFEQLRQHALKPILENKEFNEPVRIWVAGCSTGEEAYTIAILCNELMEQLGKYHELKIFATDVDPDAIAYASGGAYPLSIAEDLANERLHNAFYITEKEYVVSQAIRHKVVFAVHNLIKDPPFSNMDLVVCRNVLIYLQHSAQKKALSLMHFALRRDGNLFLGPSESLGEMSQYFETIDQRNKIFKKSFDLRVPLDTGETNRLERRFGLASPMPHMVKHLRPGEPRRSLNNVEQALINKYVPACIVLNDKKEAIHTYGDISDYIKKIKPGRVSVAINDLIENSLLVAVATALHRLSSEKKEVIYHDVKLQTDIFSRTITLRALQLAAQANQEGMYLLIFEPASVETKPEERAGEIFNEKSYAQQRIEDLEQELQQSIEKQQAMVEELETTNEELQSTNEELMSANEELQSTNEELQSVNEELFTVNSEYQQTITELTQINNDLDNLLKSTAVATVFLDRKKLIRRYTPAITRYINILPLDQDRPFGDLKHNLIIDGLQEKIESVIHGDKPFEQEVMTDDDEMVILRIHPYVTLENKVDGAVMTLVDVTKLREAEKALHMSHDQLVLTNEALYSIVQHGDNLLAAVDADYKLIGFNEAFKQSFKQLFEGDIEYGADIRNVPITRNQVLFESMMDYWNRALDGETNFSMEQFDYDGSNKEQFTISFWPVLSENGNIKAALQVAYNNDPE